MRASALLAVFACASWAEIRKRGTDHLPWGHDLVAVLLDRRPPWLHGFAKWLAAPRQLERWWPELRILEREGLIEVPRTPLYWTCMAEHLSRPWLHSDLLGVRDPWQRERRPSGDGARSAVVADVFELDEVLRERDLWSMLEVDAAVEIVARESARPLPIPGAAGLEVTLAELADAGVLRRAQLLAAALDGLARATPKTVRWFAGLFDRISPSLDEQAAARDGYLRLLEARMGAAVDVGLRGLTDLMVSGRLGAAVLAQHVGPLLASKSKGQASRGLRLLEQGVDREPGAATSVAEAAMEALHHVGPDVHAAALALLERLPVTALAPCRERLHGSIQYVTPSQRERAAALLERVPGGDQAAGSYPASPIASEVVPDIEQRCRMLLPEAAARAGLPEALAFSRGGIPTLPAVPIGDGLSPRLEAANLLSPITETDALIDTLLRGLEGAVRADEVELALDAMARMPQDRSGTAFLQRTAALCQRAEGLLGSEGLPFVGGTPMNDLAALVLAWTTGRVFEAPDYRRNPFQERLRKVAARLAAGRPTQLLAVPTHRGGWIEARVIPDRWVMARRSGDEPDAEDQVQALMRLAPDGRAGALAAASSVGAEFGRALRYALGGEEGEVCSRALWVAATRAREGRRPERDPEDDGAVPEAPQGAGNAAAGFTPPPNGTLPFDVTALLNYIQAQADLENSARSLDASLGYGREIWTYASPLAASWLASVTPACPDAFFAEEARCLRHSLDRTRLSWSGEWEPLFDPETPASPAARALLIYGLSARHPTISGLARDALIALIADGRLAATQFGRTLQMAFESEAVTHGRWLAALRDVANVSALHQWVLQQSLALAVAALPLKTATANPVLEALHEWSVEAEQAISHPRSRAQLQTMLTGKTGRLATALLGLGSNPASRVRREAARLAIEHRLERARRYEVRMLGAT